MVMVKHKLKTVRRANHTQVQNHKAMEIAQTRGNHSKLVARKLLVKYLVKA